MTTHRHNPEIKALLEHVPPHWEQRVPNGTATAYVTKCGLVVFVDSLADWIMLTECPSVSIDKNVSELGAMIEGIAGKR